MLQWSDENEKDIVGSTDWQIANESAASTKHTRPFSFPVTPAVEAKLRIFKKKFEKEKREAMS